MNWYAQSQGWTRIIPETHPNAQAIDGIFKKPDSRYGEFLIGEAKETSGKGNYMQKLGTLSDGTRQMSDDWLLHHVDNLEGVLDVDTYNELKYGIDNGFIKKQVVIYRTSGFSGKTLTKGFADDLTGIEGKSKINDVVIIGNGG